MTEPQTLHTTSFDALDQLATQIAGLRRDLSTLNEVLTMDIGIIVDALATLRSDLTDLKVQAAHGLGGSVLGVPVRLKP